jgi:hypothetical protein
MLQVQLKEKILDVKKVCIAHSFPVAEIFCFIMC